MSPSKKRPGFEAAERLSQILETGGSSIWKQVEAQLPEVVSSIPSLKRLKTSREDLASAFLMRKLDDDDDDKGSNNEHPKTSLSKDELMTIVQWKFAVGKPRNALLKHLNSNSEESIQNASIAAFAEAISIKDDGDDKLITTAIQKLTTLKGVGPATASAILSMIRPDKFCYMYDEVIDCFAPKRTYSLNEYIKINQECTRIAQSLMDHEDEDSVPWTPYRVSQCLWVAARICAANGKDRTTSKNSGEHKLPKKRTLKDSNFKQESKDGGSKKKRTKAG